MIESRDGISPLGADLVALIGRSDSFTALAASLLCDGLKSLDPVALEQEAQAGLGESLIVAYYKALVLLPDQPALLAAVTELLLRYRFLCALDGLVDSRSQAFWLRHGLDREIQESQRLHATARLSASGRVEHLCFGHQLASYFRMEPQPETQQSLSERLMTHRLEPVVGDLWRVHSDHDRLCSDREVYLLVPHCCVSIVDSQHLCELVTQIAPLLIGLGGGTDAVICAPLGTRKVSISKQGVHSCSTYFDVGKPVPFSLNRALEPYLIIAPDGLDGLSDLRARQLFFAPLVDSLSTLVFRDPADYRLGEKAFLHQRLVLPSHQPWIAPGSAAMPALLVDRRRCLMKGLLLDVSSANLAFSPCHQWADHYARCHGLYGHGPSGVMNQSVLMTDDAVLTTWRYERNFDSWSGRCADVARHPSLNFLAWQGGAPESAMASSELEVAPLTYSGYPSECKIEDLRLFSLQGKVYAISALILSRARYQQWIPEISAEAAANNTIDDMLVVQAFGRLDPARAVLEFECLPVLHPAVDSESAVMHVPTGFEKNWLICDHEAQLFLLYSIQPWRVFRGDHSLADWRLMTDSHLNLPRSIQGPLRNSAHPFSLHGASGEQRLGLVVHRRRKNTYLYDQYLMVLSSDQLTPQKISRHPILSVNMEALALDPGFRKNDGVCYVSSVLVRAGVVLIYVNLFDCRTCVFSVSMADLLALIDDEQAFASLVP